MMKRLCQKNSTVPISNVYVKKQGNILVMGSIWLQNEKYDYIVHLGTHSSKMWIFSNFDLTLCTTKVAFPCSKMSREGLQLFWKYSNCLWVSPHILLDILNMLFGCLEASETSRIKTYCLQNRHVHLGGKVLNKLKKDEFNFCKLKKLKKHEFHFLEA